MFRRIRIVYQSHKYLSNLSYKHFPTQTPLKSSTVGKLIDEIASKKPESQAIISLHQNKTLTFSQISIQSSKLAAGFLKLGLKKGDLLGIWGPNSIEWALTSYACSRLGIVLVQINPAYKSNDLEYSINKMQIKAIVCGENLQRQNFYEVLNEIDDGLSRAEKGKWKSSKVPSLSTVVMISGESGEEFKGTFNFEEILESGNRDEVEMVKKYQDDVQIDDPLNVQFTSGSTGNPKGIVLTHLNGVNNSFHAAKRIEADKLHYKVCVQVPLFHTFGTTGGLLGCLHYGFTLVFPSKTYNPQKSLEAIATERCNAVFGTPTMYVDLINQQKKENRELDIDFAATGGALTTPTVLDGMYDILKIKNVIHFYGMTETTAIAFQSFRSDTREQILNTVGHVGDHVEVKVVDKNNKIVPFGTPGELCVRGYLIMSGYYKDKDKTDSILKEDRWLHTGDLFILHENGYGKIVGRIKDLIIRGGENIFPTEIENYLVQHPDIIECQVVGIPHERLGEEVCACVRLQSKANFTQKDLVKFFDNKIAHFKIPSKLYATESFPKTGSGKIQKFKIIEDILNSKYKKL